MNHMTIIMRHYQVYVYIVYKIFALFPGIWIPCPVMIFKYKCIYKYKHELNGMAILILDFMAMAYGLF